MGWGQGQYVSQADRKGDRQRVRNAGNRGERSDAENREDASRVGDGGQKAENIGAVAPRAWQTDTLSSRAPPGRD